MQWSAIARKLPGRSDNEIKNLWHTTLKKRVTNISQCFESHNVEKSDQQDVNHANEINNFLFSWISEDDNSTSSNTPTPKGHQVEFTADIGSPGTVEDLQNFWRELYPLEDLEHINIDEEMFLDQIFQDSNDDIMAPWSFYNDEYHITPTSI
ncbi:hypothetical protein L1987_06436 [Smallanthus sonchifolius]|uniref:Uncharacterized protein n=1 Tax=Smallanthus sonchifolius TaxID=185202 RepID=A0ACB9JYC1_9ASTR|nr:hypothetical protein L1987_06436 [Smallanthus sonchifolius]